MGKIVDLSHHQSVVDYKKLATECDLAIIRVQYGSTTIDRKYKEHVAGCKKYGIPFGHYAYARFLNVKDAKVEAKDFIRRMDKSAKFLVVDVEEQTTKTKAEMAPATQAFINICKQAGYKTGLYTGHHFYKPYNMGSVNCDFLWIPRYGGAKPDFPCDLWQYTDKGSIAGIKGGVDLNKLNGTKKLSYFTGSKKNASKTPTTPKVPTIRKVGKVKVVGVKNACYVLNKPSKLGKVIATAKKGAVLPIAGSVPGWWEIIHNGKRCYINAKYGKRV